MKYVHKIRSYSECQGEEETVDMEWWLEKAANGSVRLFGRRSGSGISYSITTISDDNVEFWPCNAKHLKLKT